MNYKTFNKKKEQFNHKILLLYVCNNTHNVSVRVLYLRPVLKDCAYTSAKCPSSLVRGFFLQKKKQTVSVVLGETAWRGLHVFASVDVQKGVRDRQI